MPPRAVVVDEIHLYDSIHGAQVTRLVHRLRHRLEQAMKVAPNRPGERQWRRPLLIGMSATIGEPSQFWRRFTGLPVTTFTPSDQDYEPSGRDYTIFIRPEAESRGKHVSPASVTIQSLMVLMHNMRKRKLPSGPKYRGLVFVESIDRLKRLHPDYINAEEERALWQYRIPRVENADPAVPQDPPPRDLDGFHDGEVWYFDAQDPLQFSRRRQVKGAPPAAIEVASVPVFSGSPLKDGSLADADLLFATTSLEVGFDDPALQLVFQHRAPRNPASFLQKKGRAGRSPGDRSIMALTLSAESYLDAHYYQNPHLLTDADAYRPLMNEDNYFVQKAHAICAAIDAIVFERARGGGPQISLG